MGSPTSGASTTSGAPVCGQAVLLVDSSTSTSNINLGRGGPGRGPGGGPSSNLGLDARSSIHQGTSNLGGPGAGPGGGCTSNLGLAGGIQGIQKIQDEEPKPNKTANKK